MTSFTVTTLDLEAGPVVEFAGELDSASAPRALQAVEAISPRPGQQVVLDLTGLLFCDSSGISALIAARNLAHSAEAGLALAGVPRHLARTLVLIGLDTFFTTYATAAQAQAAWPESPAGG
ncbi:MULTISPECIES: STAS domain-containing protein [Lentzea]|uniref:Anti-sigma factor antagonist n=1 Tax=Lentzea fradiae TaxID=200378 RepID=A0A1G7WHB8_9PSEU|nr:MULTISPECIES: STAS domain-containing protein [Lentzea]GLY49963.1 anti-sigma factor antagonist [Lentzea sp. NBRC 102530]SDG71254.1 anti-anti-sigma factor [Lentzea fradiae]